MICSNTGQFNQWLRQLIKSRYNMNAKKGWKDMLNFELEHHKVSIHN